MATKKTPKKPAARRTNKAKTPAAYKLQTRSQITLEGIEGASFKDAASAILAEIQRRVAANELTELELTAWGRNGDKIVAEA